MKQKKYIIIKLIIVNLITLIRLVGAFVLPFLYINHGSSIVSFVIINLFLSDAIDGFLARKLKIPTFFGSIIDALSDKLLNIISFIILGLEYNIMFAPLIIEIAILYTMYSTYRYGGNVQSSIVGKIKTIILDIFVILSFVLLSLPVVSSNNTTIIFLMASTDIFISIFGIIIIIACIVALYDYMIKNKYARNNPKSMEIKQEKRTRKKLKLIIKQLFDTEYYKKHKDESIIKQFYI